MFYRIQQNWQKSCNTNYINRFQGTVSRQQGASRFPSPLRHIDPGTISSHPSLSAWSNQPIQRLAAFSMYLGLQTSLIVNHIKHVWARSWLLKDKKLKYLKMQRKHINQLVIAFDRLFPSQVKILDQSCQIERFGQILAKQAIYQTLPLAP